MEKELRPETTFLEELKRRKVVRAALVYAAGAFAVLQVADIVVEPLGLPPGAMSTIVWACIVGFPLVLGLSWFLDLSKDEDGARRWVSVRAGVAVAVLGVAGVAGWILRPDGDDAPLSPTGEVAPEVVAVLPFTVLGSDDARYLSDAVAKLLGTSLDGVAGLRTVSSHALMGYPGLRREGVTESLAEEVAAHFGAGLWIIGDVLQAGDSIRIGATLAPGSGLSGQRVSAEVTAGVDDLFASVDQLAALLVAEREAGSGSQRTRAAALTTGSMAALRAWIEGERAFRAGSYLPAVDAFTRAV
ncbi:MAG TPA: hypothetical protein VLA43_07975, partial [Longimicrobiales bacterium]|nr:hypothetical protein [Longimicrobiales bacterium]